MKKIMFNDKYGLTKAVLEGRKTMTRRAVSECIYKKAQLYRQEYFEDTLSALCEEDSLLAFSPFKPGDVVAVAQSYRDIMPYLADSFCQPHSSFMKDKPGFTNKMFVRGDLMPHRIRITNVRVEKLQDISGQDYEREGIDYVGGYSESYYFGHGAGNIRLGNSPREAFATLIDKVSGKGTWKSNPWVFVYEFELV